MQNDNLDYWVHERKRLRMQKMGDVEAEEEEEEDNDEIISICCHC